MQNPESPEQAEYFIYKGLNWHQSYEINSCQKMQRGNKNWKTVCGKRPRANKKNINGELKPSQQDQGLSRGG